MVDTGEPCRAYRITPDQKAIQRSLDYGFTWQTVLDAASAAQPAMFRRIYSAGPGVLYVAEVGNGDALIRSGDGGTTWTLADGQPSDPVNLIGEYTFAVATRYDAATATDTVYVATLSCFSQRPRPATCSTQQSLPIFRQGQGFTPPQTGDSGDYNHGPMRVYVSRDGGRSWRLFMDVSTATPSTCDVGYLYIVTDPYSPPDRDHVWVAWRANYNTFDTLGLSCAQAPAGTVAWIDANYDGNTYQYQVKQTRPSEDLNAPFAVTRAPTGETELINPSWPVYSNDDGTTWQPYAGADVRLPQNVAALPNGDVVGLRNWTYGGVDTEPNPTEPRAVIWRGGDMQHISLGAAFATSPGSPARSLYAWPHDDAQLPTFDGLMLTDVSSEYAGQPIEIPQVDAAGDLYVNVGEVCDDPQCTPSTSSSPDLVGKEMVFSTQWARWQLMRYTPGPRSSTPTLKASATAGGGGPSDSGSCVNQGRCNLVPTHSCALAPSAGDAYSGHDIDGSLAFDGGNLYYTRTGERSSDADPMTAVIHRVRTASLGGSSCQDAGPITIHFDKQEFSAARLLTPQTAVPNSAYSTGRAWALNPVLPAQRPHVDAMAYDADHDRLYFTLTPENVAGDRTAAQGNNLFNATQLALWEADLHSVNGVPASSITAHLVTVNTGYCHDSSTANQGSTSQTLAYDRIGDNLPTNGHPDGVLWACLPGRPAELDQTGQQIDQPCYGAALLNGWAETGIHVGTWAMEDMSAASGRHRALLLNDFKGQVDVFDLNRCANDRIYTMPKQYRPSQAAGSQTLACDPVTYGSGTLAGNSTESAQLATALGAPPFAGSLTGAVLWQKTGRTLTAELIPDNNDALAQRTESAAGAAADAQTCRLPVSLTYTGPTVPTPGQPMTLSVRLSIDGPAAPAVGQVVQATINGVVMPGPVRTDAEGVARLTVTPQTAAPMTVTFGYAPPDGNLAFYPASPVTVVLDVLHPLAVPNTAPGPPPGSLPQPPPPQGPRPPAPPPPPPPVLTQPVPAGQAPPQSGGQGQGQSASARARQRERQLAMAGANKQNQEEPAVEPPTDDESTYAMSAIRASSSDVGPGIVASLATIAILAGLGYGLSRSPARARAFNRRSMQRRERR